MTNSLKAGIWTSHEPSTRSRLSGLTNVLRESGEIDKSTVESVSANVLDGGATSEVQKLVIEYDLDAEQAPKSIIAKIAHQDPETRSLVDDLSLYETEILFYQHFNKGVGITVPDIYFSSYDHATKEMLLLQEDLSDLRSIAPGIECNFDDAVNAFDAAAGFHAKWWDNESLFDIPWLIDYSDEEYATNISGKSSPHIDSFVEKAGSYLPKGVEQIIRDLAPRYAEVVSHSGTRPVTLNHGDYKPTNLFFDDSENAESPIVAFDWQVVQRGRSGTDLGQFFLTSFSNNTRTAIEKQLITGYHNALLNRGVTGYSMDELYFDSQVGILSQMPLRTLGLVFRSEKLLETEVGTATFASECDRLKVLIDWNYDEVIPK